ncbi:MAG: methylmalonyl Co-A mutase-associated GTPase MeaB, partial [Candidatus Thermoplasmatota archaeon]
ETVGAGQSEVEVASRAHTTVVVQMPQSGDAVQVLKAGILEIGDVYVVNKTDLGGADVVATNLQFMIDEKEGWRAPVAKTSALEGKGIPELADAIERHHKHLRSGPLWERRESDRARKELLESMRRLLAETFSEKEAGEAFESNVKSIVARRIDPRTAAAKLLHDLPRSG